MEHHRRKHVCCSFLHSTSIDWTPVVWPAHKLPQGAYNPLGRKDLDSTMLELLRVSLDYLIINNLEFRVCARKRTHALSLSLSVAAFEKPAFKKPGPLIRSKWVLWSKVGRGNPEASVLLVLLPSHFPPPEQSLRDPPRKNNNSNKKWSDFKAYHHPPSQTREPQGIITGPEKTLSVAF